MNSLLTLEVDTTAVLAAIDQLIAAGHASPLERRCQAAAKATADRIQVEARARARRATGQLAAAVTVDEAPPPLGGYNVFVAPMPPRPENFALWHEVGTSKMTAQPFLWSSARLEAAAHERRIAQAVQDAINEVGLGR